MKPNDVERELRSLLSVDPAPGFQARVRERIDREPQPRGWSFPVMFAGVGLVAAVVVSVFIFLPRGGGKLQQPPAIVVTKEVPRPSVITSPPESPNPHRQAPKTVKPEPQLMIAASEANALRRLLSGEVKELPSRFEPPVREFQIPEPVVKPLASPEPINVEPLVLPAATFEDIRR